MILNSDLKSYIYGKKAYILIEQAREHRGWTVYCADKGSDFGCGDATAISISYQKPNVESLRPRHPVLIITIDDFAAIYLATLYLKT